jgi:hypothetical protein
MRAESASKKRRHPFSARRSTGSSKGPARDAQNAVIWMARSLITLIQRLPRTADLAPHLGRPPLSMAGTGLAVRRLEPPRRASRHPGEHGEDARRTPAASVLRRSWRGTRNTERSEGMLSFCVPHGGRGQAIGLDRLAPPLLWRCQPACYSAPVGTSLSAASPSAGVSSAPACAFSLVSARPAQVSCSSALVRWSSGWSPV